jgi:hypothetical protein
MDAGDIDACAALMREDIVVDWTNSLGPYAGMYHGREAILDMWSRLLESMEAVSFAETEPRVRLDDGRVILTTRQILRGTGCGAEVAVRGSTVYEIGDDGLIAAYAMFQERSEALAAPAPSSPPPPTSRTRHVLPRPRSTWASPCA